MYEAPVSIFQFVQCFAMAEVAGIQLWIRNKGAGDLTVVLTTMYLEEKKKRTFL